MERLHLPLPWRGFHTWVRCKLQSEDKSLRETGWTTWHKIAFCPLFHFYKPQKRGNTPGCWGDPVAIAPCCLIPLPFHSWQSLRLAHRSKGRKFPFRILKRNRTENICNLSTAVNSLAASHRRHWEEKFSKNT